MMKHKARETWLQEGIELLDKEFFSGRDNKLPNKIRVSCGFPKRATHKAIGQCWDNIVSEDETYEIFVSPTKAESVRVLDILLHELIHASVGTEHGHRGPFRTMAKGFGLAGKMTATYAEEGTELYEILSKISSRLGKYPHAPMKELPSLGSTSLWVRYKSEKLEDFKVVANIRQVEKYGVPKDPTGENMVPNAD